MREQWRNIVGVGTALVDIKVINPTRKLPNSHIEVSGFLSDQREVYRGAGGSMATTMVVLARLMPPGSVNFLQKIGMDDDGEFYRQHTPIELSGGIQVDVVHPTGICVFAITNGAQKIDQWPEVTFYGASDELTIPKGTGSNGDIFITNINAYRRFAPKRQIVDAIQEVADGDGIFVFRLSGIKHGIDEKFDKKELDLLLSSLPKLPDILFANAVELKHASGIDDTYQATQRAFPESRLMVITNGENGSLVRFKGNILEISPEPISQSDVVDTTGAGDNYMGGMLAALFTRPYSHWTLEFIASCAKIGTHASALVIQSFDSRLTGPQLMDIREKISLMTVEQGVDESLTQKEESQEPNNIYRNA